MMAYVPHKNGRPRREEGQTVNYTIRFTHEELATAKGVAEEKQTPLAVLVRKAMVRAGLLPAS